MKSEIVKTTDTSTTLKVQMSRQSFEPIVRATFDDLRPRVKVAGFRPGKAPDHIVERELGSQLVQNEVLEAAVTHSYTAALDEHGVVTVAPPQVSVIKFVPYDELEYTATVDVMPKTKLGDYKSIRVKAPDTKVEPAEVEGVIDDLRRRLAERKPAERAAAQGDELLIDFEGKRDGQPVQGASSKSYPLALGSNTFIPGFENELNGLKAGDQKSFDIRFPKDYSEPSLAGQVVTFDVTVKEVRAISLPALSDDFAASVGPFKSLDELRADIQTRLEAEKKEAQQQELEHQVLTELIRRTDPKSPPSLVAHQLERMRRELSDRLASSGLSVEKYLEMKGTTADKLDEEMRPEAERRVKLAMVLTEVAKAEDLSVTPEEVTAEIARLKSSYQDPEMQAELNGSRIKEDVYNHLMASKTIARLTEYASKS